MRKIYLIFIFSFLLALSPNIAEPANSNEQSDLESQDSTVAEKMYERYVNDGIHYLQQRQYNQAEKEFLKAQEIVPDAVDAYINLGVLYIHRKNIADAIYFLHKAEGLILDEYPQKDILFYNLGLAYHMDGDFETAAQYYSRALEINPNFTEAENGLELIFIVTDGGQEPYLQTTSDRPSQKRRKPGSMKIELPWDEINRASRERKSSPYLERDEEAESTESLAPGQTQEPISVTLPWDEINQASQARRGSTYLEKDGEVESIEILDEEQTQEPIKVEVSLEDVDELTEEEKAQIEENYEDLKETEEVEPAADLTEREIQESVKVELPWDEMAETEARSVEKETKEDKILLAKKSLKEGAQYFESGDAEMAIEKINESIKLNPRDADAYYRLGIIYSYKNDLPKAIEAFNNTIKYKPTSSKAYLNLGGIYGTLKEYDKALHSLKRSLTLDRSNPKIYYNIAMVYVAKKNQSQANIYLEKAKKLAIKQNNEVLLEKINKIYK